MASVVNASSAERVIAMRTLMETGLEVGQVVAVRTWQRHTLQRFGHNGVLERKPVLTVAATQIEGTVWHARMGSSARKQCAGEQRYRYSTSGTFCSVAGTSTSKTRGQSSRRVWTGLFILHRLWSIAGLFGTGFYMGFQQEPGPAIGSVHRVRYGMN